MTFQEAGIAPELIKAIEELGFTSLMPVQDQVIPQILKSDIDIIALAQTGTGKTAAFGLPVLQKTDKRINNVQTLILSPTRELCIQIADDLMDFAKYMDDIRIVPVYGGASIDTQIRALKKGAHIVVATPGRLVDMIERRAIKLDNVRVVVLDEADEMLTMGFSESIEAILSKVPKQRSTYLFSATMPLEIARIAKKYMNSPKEIQVGHKNAGADNIKHICYAVHAKDKYATLKRIVDYTPNIYGIVFCRTRRDTQEIADALIADGYNSEPLHGDLSQSQRDSVMAKFRSKKLSFLVATDVAARGIDVNDLTHIINYNLPEDTDSYNHRSGRTGRAGKTGVSIAIINMKEKFRIKQIENKIGKEFIWKKVPNGAEVCEKQLFHLIEKIEHIEIEHDEIEPFLPMIYKKLGWLEKEDLIKRLVSVEFNRFLQYYRDAPDLNQRDVYETKDRNSGRRERETRGNEYEGDFSKLFVNVGRTDGCHPTMMIEMLNKINKGSKFKIGKIEIFKNHSICEIESSFSNTIINNMNGVNFDDRKLVVREDGHQSSGRSSRELPRRNKKRTW